MGEEKLISPSAPQRLEQECDGYPVVAATVIYWAHLDVAPPVEFDLVG